MLRHGSYDGLRWVAWANLEAIVFGNGIVVILVSSRDVRVLAEMRNVQVLIVPQHLGDGLLLFSLQVPGKPERAEAGRSQPGELIEFAIDTNWLGGPMDLIGGQLSRRTAQVGLGILSQCERRRDSVLIPLDSSHSRIPRRICSDSDAPSCSLMALSPSARSSSM